ncbi:MAG: DNA mismatch repair protein MutS [Bacteroidales bacterium]|jgi:DNA mismatch repair protein MutS|nr:DNA mismatch repair protein MutS [Bacteroidales bacterium]
MAEKVVETPLMKQYYQIKHKHSDAILLFRVGDFYETFSEDAIKTSKILGITLTKRANGSASFVELAGFPYHSLDTYLPKLVRAGQRVAICEQLEDPSKTKTIVKRGVTELVTPGVSLSNTILENRENNFLAAVHFGKQSVGVAFLDISTGEFLVGEGNAEYVDKLIGSFQPKEVLYDRSKEQLFKETFAPNIYSYKLDDWIFTTEAANDKLLAHFETASLKGFGIDAMPQAIIAAGAILYYMELTEHKHINHIRHIARIEQDDYVWLDRFTIRNLEIFASPHEGATSLLHVLDETQTPMGARLLKRWLALPLKSKQEIDKRLSVVQQLVEHRGVLNQLYDRLHNMCDLERIVARVAAVRILPREILQLQRTLEDIAPIKALCGQQNNSTMNMLSEQLNACEQLAERIGREINPETPNVLNKGNVIAAGVNEELDKLRSIAYSGKDFILQMQQREEERTGIPKLKVAFNNVFGYYIEVRNTHKDKVPADWIRKQTIVSAERYITPELKEYENQILGAEEKILQLEGEIFAALVQNITQYIPTLQLNAHILAQIDCLQSFAQCAIERNYAKPEIDESLDLHIEEGRHPVIETRMAPGEEYVSNTVQLDCDTQQIIIITGPNMAGKSALLRQTALIVLMAQIGSFVPARAARIGIVDKIFTRVGASDNISQGESTFMVEMNEAASILNNISERSLVLFDELGRGTSTYDGISIAWSIVEYLHEHPAVHPKTLFATHYHELNELENSFKRVKNFNVSVKEYNNRVIFLRKLVPGGSEHSFGIHVAKMAGLPKSIIKRANEVLKELEGNNRNDANSTVSKQALHTAGEHREGYQLSIFQLDDPVLSQIREQLIGLDINNLTPIDALNALNDIKKLLGK